MAEEIKQPHNRKIRILLAEDDANISVIAKLSLERLGGFDVTVVHDGEQALHAALTGNYDLVLLDEMMPKKNGLLVCKEYKEQTQEPKPVIFLSAKSQESDLREFSANGIGFIPKPFDPMRLSEQIHMLLKQKGIKVAC
jgi:DNA-binding response OmpR family regulator